MTGGWRPPTPPPPVIEFPETLPIWPVDEQAQLVLADFEIYGLKNMLFSVSSSVAVVDLEGTNLVIYYDENERVFKATERPGSGTTGVFRSTTGSNLPGSSSAVRIPLPNESDINYRAIPAE